MAAVAISSVLRPLLAKESVYSDCVRFFGLFASGQLLNFSAFICHNFRYCIAICKYVRVWQGGMMAWWHGGRGPAFLCPSIHFSFCCVLPFLFIFVITINYIFLRLSFCPTHCQWVCVVCVCSFAKLFYVAVACLWLFDIIWIKKINPGPGPTAILIFYSTHPEAKLWFSF